VLNRRAGCSAHACDLRAAGEDMDPMTFDDRAAQLYQIQGKTRQASLWFVAGLGLIVVAVIGFISAIFDPAGQFQLQLRTTLPMLMAIAAFARAWAIGKLPREIEVSAQGVRIRRRDRQEDLAWDDIGWAAVDKTPMGQQRRLTMYDAQGKKLVVI